MKIRVAIRTAWRALGRNKMRSVLTVLGIVIGVSSVIALVSIGQAAKGAIEASIDSIGANLLTVVAGSRTQGGIRSGWGLITTLSLEDVDAIRREAPDVALAAPGVRSVAQVVAGNQNWSTAVFGTVPDYVTVRSWGVERGRFVTDDEVRGAAKVAVLGQTPLQKLFPGGQDPIGQVIRIKKIPFVVVGTLVAKGVSGWGQDQDDAIWVPLTTAQKRLMGITHLGQIYLSATSRASIASAEGQVTDILRRRHRIQPGQDDDFMIMSPAEFGEAAQESRRAMTRLVAGIASVSLLVGGIGIMNIMLVSVTERTREIGLRMALGARRRDILAQFLVEALVLALVGGAIGTGLGIGGSVVFTSIARWPTVIAPEAILAALIFSAAVGLFFGFYPARKASLQSPIEALRYE